MLQTLNTLVLWTAARLSAAPSHIFSCDSNRRPKAQLRPAARMLADGDGNDDDHETGKDSLS